MSERIDLEKSFNAGELDKFYRGVEKLAYAKLHRNPITVSNYIDYCDIVQDIQINVWKAMENYDSSKANVVTYCTTIIDNTIRYHIKRSNTMYKYGTAPNTEDELEVMSTVISKDGYDNYNKLLIELEVDKDKIMTEEEQEVLSYCYDGLSAQSISTMTKLSIATTYRRIESVRSKIVNWVSI